MEYGLVDEILGVAAAAGENGENKDAEAPAAEA